MTNAFEGTFNKAYIRFEENQKISKKTAILEKVGK